MCGYGVIFPVTPDINLALIVSEFGWAFPIIIALITLTIEFKNQQSAKHLNRLRYWLIATTLFGGEWSGLLPQS